MQSHAHEIAALLKQCAKCRDLRRGCGIHRHIVRLGLLEDQYVANSLISMYARCGELTKAQQLLDDLPVRGVISWSAMISGYAQHGQGEKAVICFERMQSEGLSPNSVTFTCILKACASIGAVDKGKQVHGEIIRLGLLQSDVIVATALVDMYAKCGALVIARRVLDEFPYPNVVCWNALITGYVQQGHAGEAINCFQQMHSAGVPASEVTFTCILKACASIGAVDKGELIHRQILEKGFLAKYVNLGNSLVDMYSKCGALAKAQQVVEELPVRDMVSWNALITGYADHKNGDKALDCFKWMLLEGFSPGAVTFSSILKACGSIGEASKGKWIHDEIIKQGLLGSNVVLGTALVDMYVKCGALSRAKVLLYELPVRNTVCWSVLITGYAQQGQSMEALNCFRRMESEGILPDSTTLICVLNACSHSGLVADGEMYFENMISKYDVHPDFEHYTCMVDLFGRAGEFDKALVLIRRMPSSDCLAVWSALLNACRKWGNIGLGKMAFNHAIQIEEKEDAPYICLTSIYAAAGMQEDADKIEAMRVNAISSSDIGYELHLTE